MDTENNNNGTIRWKLIRIGICFIGAYLLYKQGHSPLWALPLILSPSYIGGCLYRLLCLAAIVVLIILVIHATL